MKKLLLIVLICAGFAACKKDKGPGRRELIIGRWALTAAEAVSVYNGDTMSSSSANGSFGCEGDDTYIFAENSVISYDPGAEKCQGDPQSVQVLGNWFLSNGDTKLEILAAGDTSRSDILVLDNLTMKLRSESTEDLNGQPVRTISTVTFNRR